MTEPVYRLTPEDHATLDDVVDRLEEARWSLGYDDVDGLLEDEPSRVPDKQAVLHAGDSVDRALTSLREVLEAHEDEDEEREQAAAMRATDLAQGDQDEATTRDLLLSRREEADQD